MVKAWKYMKNDYQNTILCISCSALTFKDNLWMCFHPVIVHKFCDKRKCLQYMTDKIARSDVAIGYHSKQSNFGNLTRKANYDKIVLKSGIWYNLNALLYLGMQTDNITHLVFQYFKRNEYWKCLFDWYKQHNRNHQYTFSVVGK